MYLNEINIEKKLIFKKKIIITFFFLSPPPRLENTLQKNGMRKVLIFCKYWLINKTGLRLLYKQMYLGKIAAGQTEWEDLPCSLQEDPSLWFVSFLFFFCFFVLLCFWVVINNIVLFVKKKKKKKKKIGMTRVLRKINQRKNRFCLILCERLMFGTVKCVSRLLIQLGLRLVYYAYFYKK